MTMLECEFCKKEKPKLEVPTVSSTRYASLIPVFLISPSCCSAFLACCGGEKPRIFRG